jgi:hypothetical protein
MSIELIDPGLIGLQGNCMVINMTTKNPQNGITNLLSNE